MPRKHTRKVIPKRNPLVAITMKKGTRKHKLRKYSLRIIQRLRQEDSSE